MKQYLFATIALWMCCSAAVAAPLSEEEKAYVGAAVGMMRVTVECDGYEDLVEELDKLGDRNGVDGPALRKAIAEALRVRLGNGYDRAKLIPEVTRAFNEFWNIATREKARSQRKFCKQWGDALIDKGLIRKKP